MIDGFSLCPVIETKVSLRVVQSAVASMNGKKEFI
jgi:hypothetical protein